MIIEGFFAVKRQWRAYRARVLRLPTAYRTTALALERYLMHTGPSDTEHLMPMLDDLVDLCEQSAADGVSVHELVGDDPIEFAETFKRNYGQGSWLSSEQQRLVDAVREAEEGRS